MKKFLILLFLAIMVLSCSITPKEQKIEQVEKIQPDEMTIPIELYERISIDNEIKVIDYKDNGTVVVDLTWEKLNSLTSRGFKTCPPPTRIVFTGCKKYWICGNKGGFYYCGWHTHCTGSKCK